MTRKMHNGRCTHCNTFFVGMDKWEYNWSVTRHLREHHDGAEPNEVMERL